jgi:hypothetical protein
MGGVVDSDTREIVWRNKRGATDNARAKDKCTRMMRGGMLKRRLPFQWGYDCNLESGDIGNSKARNKQILTDHI